MAEVIYALSLNAKGMLEAVTAMDRSYLQQPNTKLLKSKDPIFYVSEP